MTVSAVEKVKQRQKKELDAIGAIGAKQKKITTHDEAIGKLWEEIGADLRVLQELGWAAKDIAEVVEVDTRKVTALLREPDTAGANSNGSAGS